MQKSAAEETVYAVSAGFVKNRRVYTTAACEEEIAKLTDNEWRVFTHLASKPGELCSYENLRKQIRPSPKSGPPESIQNLRGKVQSLLSLLRPKIDGEVQDQGATHFEVVDGVGIMFHEKAEHVSSRLRGRRKQARDIQEQPVDGGQPVDREQPVDLFPVVPIVPFTGTQRPSPFAWRPLVRSLRSRPDLEVVLVPGGSFRMGAPYEYHESRFTDSRTRQLVDAVITAGGSRPRHVVHLSSFLIGRFPITNAQYAVFLQETDYPPPPELPLRDSFRGPRTFEDLLLKHPRWPVINVSWRDAKRFADHVGMRLPFEAEHEYATRGPDGPIFAWGNTYPTDASTYANFGGTEGGPTPVDRYPKGASPFGAWDLCGNVWEVCEDWYDKYEPGEAVNPRGPLDGEEKVRRGGSWQDDPHRIAACERGKDSIDWRAICDGFRVAAPLTDDWLMREFAIAPNPVDRCKAACLQLAEMLRREGPEGFRKTSLKGSLAQAFPGIDFLVIDDSDGSVILHHHIAYGRPYRRRNKGIDHLSVARSLASSHRQGLMRWLDHLRTDQESETPEGDEVYPTTLRLRCAAWKYVESRRCHVIAEAGPVFEHLSPTEFCDMIDWFRYGGWHVGQLVEERYAFHVRSLASAK